MLHCHIETHSDSGMMLMLKVGDDKDLPEKPPNWPTCGSYAEYLVSKNHALAISLQKLEFYFFFIFLVLSIL